MKTDEEAIEQVLEWDKSMDNETLLALAAPDLADRLQKANERVKELEKVIADAPHDEQCMTRFVQINRSPGEERPNLCNCWKSRALKTTP